MPAVHDVLILSLVDGGACSQRVPVLHCSDALRATGATVTAVAAASDAEIDEVLARFDDPARADGLTWPATSSSVRLIAAVENAGQLRHILRRLVRRYAAPGSKRPADLPDGRTIPDLPPLGILPLADLEFIGQLGLPSTPADVAAAVTAGTVQRLDLLRHDGGSVTLDGVLLGEAGEGDVPVPWQGRIEVDDVVLSSGNDHIVALAIANGHGAATLDGLPLITAADPADGLIDVAIAVPVVHKPLLGRQRMRYEVRRARGRAVAVTPHATELPFIDDTIPGALTRKRSWWIEPGAWSVYTATGRRNDPNV